MHIAQDLQIVYVKVQSCQHIFFKCGDTFYLLSPNDFFVYCPEILPRLNPYQSHENNYHFHVFQATIIGFIAIVVRFLCAF